MEGSTQPIWTNPEISGYFAARPRRRAGRRGSAGLLLAALALGPEGGRDLVLRRRDAGQAAAGRQGDAGQAVLEAVSEAFWQAGGQAAGHNAACGGGIGVGRARLARSCASGSGGAAGVAARTLLLAGLLAASGRLGRAAPHARYRGHAWHAAAEHLAHLLLALEEVRDQGADLAGADAGAAGDPGPAGAIDDLGVAALFGSHRLDDGGGTVQVPVVDLAEHLAVFRGAREHAEQVADRP